LIDIAYKPVQFSFQHSVHLFTVLWEPERSGSGVQVGRAAQLWSQSVIARSQLSHHPLLVSYICLPPSINLSVT